jgi:hypothetical protein
MKVTLFQVTDFIIFQAIHCIIYQPFQAGFEIFYFLQICQFFFGLRMFRQP